jgi:hypothetical protein
MLDLNSHFFWQITDGLLLSGVEKTVSSLPEEAAEEVQQGTVRIQ